MAQPAAPAAPAGGAWQPPSSERARLEDLAKGALRARLNARRAAASRRAATAAPPPLAAS